MKHEPSLFVALLASLAALLAGCGPSSSLPASIVHAAGSTSSPGTAVRPAQTAPTPSPTQAARATDQLGPAGTATSGIIGGATADVRAGLSPSLTPMPPAATSAGVCTEVAGHFISVSVPSSILPYDIETRIYLPPCYGAPGQAYPVLYLLHGLNFNEDQWEKLGIGGAADHLIAGGAIAPLIIVLPRDRDDLRLDPAFIVDLIPYIDGHFRTRPAATYRAIGGLSHGGGWSIHLGLRYPYVFSRVGAHSPAVFYGDDHNILQFGRAIRKSGSSPALYIDVGDVDSEPQSAAWLDQIFTSLGLPHTYLVQSGDHSERYWSRHLADYLRFYAAGWRPPLPPTPISRFDH